ncbi:YlbG family protein [Lapidilactobacillus luobeiensis]|uniref:YlbG family protein n=1 Tax=Lapidilactobacillus luobeiensis TaxID=2950371 RepID=UPI0021C46567|nr:YlbG family protein [Lapidilactobacillus luobeiensis]
MFKIKARTSLAVWVYSLKQIRQLRHYGLVYYVSKRMKYVIIYVDQDQAERVTKSLEHLRFVRKVEPSYRRSLDLNLGEKLDQEAAAESRGE